MKLRYRLSVVFMCTCLASWRIDAESPSGAGADCSTLTATNIDDCIRLNEIQVLGTHNSYHIAPAAPILALLGPRGRNIEYTHRPLTEQLAELGIRTFALDVFADPQGGHFANPAALRMVKGLDPADPALREPGFKVLHTQDEDHVITPDRVRGTHKTLAEAIQSDGWPFLRAVRGKVLFALDNTDAHKTDYVRGNPSLEGRMLFVSSIPGEPSAAFIKMNEALGAEEERIRQHVRQRYLIRTRADIPTEDARTGSTTRRDSAFRSGAQYVSTDYPEPSPFGSGYRARLPGAERLTARCNPVNAPPGCRDEWLERVSVR